VLGDIFYAAEVALLSMQVRSLCHNQQAISYWAVFLIGHLLYSVAC